MKKLVSWVEIPATDFERAVGFYGELLQTDFQIVEGYNEKMACFPSNDGAISYSPSIEPSSTGTLVSLNVESNMDDALKKTPSLGGTVIKPKTKIEAEGMDYFALIIDTEGNKVGLYGK